MWQLYQNLIALYYKFISCYLIFGRDFLDFFIFSHIFFHVFHFFIVVQALVMMLYTHTNHVPSQSSKQKSAEHHCQQQTCPLQINRTDKIEVLCERSYLVAVVGWQIRITVMLLNCTYMGYLFIGNTMLDGTKSDQLGPLPITTDAQQNRLASSANHINFFLALN